MHNQLSCVGVQAGIVDQPPEHDLGIEQQTHQQPNKRATSCSTASPKAASTAVPERAPGWTAVEAPSYDEELGEANQFHRNLAEKQRLLEIGQQYRHHYCNAEDLSDEHLNQYDLIFSIACFEHINRLPLAIKRMLQYLKPGGKLFTMHSPIWSAFDGHHLPIGIPERFNKQLPQQSYIFQPWGHLLQTRNQTFANIKNRFDSTFAEEVIYNTYNSNHINRYFSEDYQIIFEDSGFNIEEYQITFPRNPSPEIQAALESRFPGYKQFGNNGIYAILRKPETSVVIF